MLSQPLFLLAWLSATALAQLTTHSKAFVPDHVIRVGAQNISQACNERYSVVINGTSPGPAIRLKAGQPSWIRVYNDIPDTNLTMHWHGLAQYMAQFSDGAPLASQWPIPPLNYFDYEVEVTASEAGTYFYHSHVGIQALTAFGALIVEDCGAPPYAYDDERTLLWHDHFRQDDKTFETGLLASPLVFGGETVGVLLNGQGVAINHTAGERGGSDHSCQLPVLEVEPAKTYRFRFVGATSLTHLTLGFEDHANLTVIGVDGGQYTQPAATDRIQLGSGQRFDVLVQTKSVADLEAAGRSDFYMQFETRDRPSVYLGYGILRYKAAATTKALAAIAKPPAAPPLNLPAETYTWLESTLTPLTPSSDFPALDEVTRRIVIDAVQLVSPATNQTIWRLAGLSWNEVDAFPVPLLVDIYQRGQAVMPDMAAALANGGWDPRTKSFPVDVDEVLEIVLQNTGSLIHGGVDVHPFHAHGQHYYDLGSGDGTYDPVKIEKDRVARGYQPVLRDTTLLYRYLSKTTAGAKAGWRAWRLRVKYPGVWMVHCHTLQHMVMGMQSVWVVGNASDIQKIPTDLSSGYFTYGGSVYGNSSYAPAVYRQFDHSKNTCSK